MLCERLLARQGVVMAALHDVGKVAPGFQAKCPEWLKKHGIAAKDCRGEEDHAKIGQKSVQDALATDALRFWAVIVGAHHGRLKGDRISAICDGGTAWAAERRRLLDRLIHDFGGLPDVELQVVDGRLWFNAGLVAVADWLASDERYFPPIRPLDENEIRQCAVQQLAAIGFAPVKYSGRMTFSGLFPFEPNALQSVLAEAVRRPGVYVVESSMGSGKTEAALMAAYNLLEAGEARGIYFALPTQTTSNRIHRRVAEFVDRMAPGAGARLIHGNSWLLDADVVHGRQEGDAKSQEGKHDGRDWFASSRRALLAPFGVGTVDQALLGVVAVKHFFVRQFGLAGKVVILDEVHSYDLYTGTLIGVLIRRLRELGATVIVLSATLTAGRRRELLGEVNSPACENQAQYPLVSACHEGAGERAEVSRWTVPPDASKRIALSFRPTSELAEACLAKAEGGACVLWIRNTVNDAQSTYRELKGRVKIGGPEIALLHARFPMFRREKLETDWLDRLGKDGGRRPRQGCILIATQVAEQSVDIDADVLVTDLAPTDMLLQRLGRLWRHQRQRPAVCGQPEAWIGLPSLELGSLRTVTLKEIRAALGKSGKVYAPYVLLRTLAEWRDRDGVTLPADIRPILEATYAPPTFDEPTAWRELRELLEKKKERMSRLALANANVFQVALDDQEGTQTRWGECPTATVVIARHADSGLGRNTVRLMLLDGTACEIRKGEFDFNVAKAVHRNAVKVPRWTVAEKLHNPPAGLAEYVQGGCLIGVLHDEALMTLDKQELGLEYREDLGVVIPEWTAPARGRSESEDDDESYDW